MSFVVCIMSCFRSDYVEFRRVVMNLTWSIVCEIVKSLICVSQDSILNVNQCSGIFRESHFLTSVDSRHNVKYLTFEF